MDINQDFPTILLTNLFVYFVSPVALFIGNNGTCITTLGILYGLNACDRPNVFSVGLKPIFNLESYSYHVENMGRYVLYRGRLYAISSVFKPILNNSYILMMLRTG